MEWIQAYAQDKPPTFEDIERFISSPLWRDMNAYLQDVYAVQPRMTYSTCSGQPGWNVKYQKSGKALCTLYPMEGFFIALVVIGTKEQDAAELMLPSLSPYTQALFGRTAFSAGGRWLMIYVTDKDILRDAKRLMELRVKPKVESKVKSKVEPKT